MPGFFVYEKAPPKLYGSIGERFVAGAVLYDMTVGCAHGYAQSVLKCRSEGSAK